MLIILNVAELEKICLAIMLAFQAVMGTCVTAHVENQLSMGFSIEEMGVKKMANSRITNVIACRHFTLDIDPLATCSCQL